MSRFLFITAWLLLWCQGFCSLQHGYFYDVKVSVHYSMITFMMSRFLFMTAWLLLWCQGFCSLQHGCHWRRRNSIQGRVRSPYGDTEQERRGRTTGIHADASGDACRNHSHRFVCLCVIMGYLVGIIPTGLFVSALLQVTNSSLWMYGIRHSPITLQSCRLVHVLQNSLVWNYCLYWMNLMVPWTNNAFILYLLYCNFDVLNIFLCSHEVSIHQE